MKNKNLLILYALVCIIEIIAEFFEYSMLRYCVKPLLMPVLSVFFYTEAKNRFNSFAKKILAALVFSWAGDVFLMFPDCFLPGLVSFLIAHVFYILAFYENLKTNPQQRSFLTTFLFALPFLFFSSIMFSAIFPYLGKMSIPVAVYTSVISIMGISAALRKGSVTGESYIYVLAGAIIFMTSDSTIAINKFMYNGDFPYARIIIMVTYLLAQYLITIGCLKFINSQQKK